MKSLNFMFIKRLGQFHSHLFPFWLSQAVEKIFWPYQNLKTQLFTQLYYVSVSPSVTQIFFVSKLGISEQATKACDV